MKCSLMDFEEFLWAKGYDETFVEDMLEHMQNAHPLQRGADDGLHARLFLDYCILGGMPAVVREYHRKRYLSRGLLEVQQTVARRLQRGHPQICGGHGSDQNIECI